MFEAPVEEIWSGAKSMSNFSFKTSSISNINANIKRTKNKTKQRKENPLNISLK